MKKFFFVLLSVFILSGCGQDDVPQFALDPVTSQNGSDNVTLRVNPTNLIIKNGKSKELQAFLVHADGTETSVKANFVSKNPSVLTVNDQTVTADIALSSFETTEISASYDTADGKKLTDTVFVSIFSENDNANEVIGINTDHSHLVLYVGNTISINAFSINGRGDLVAITPTWDSSDNTVATVSNGLVTAVQTGRALISVKYVEGTKTFSKNVSVLVIQNSVAPTDVVGLEVFPESLIMKNNDSKQLQAFLVHADGSETPVKASLVSKNPSILTVNDQTITADIALSAFETTEIIASYNTADGKLLSDTVFVSIFSESVNANEVVGINTDQSNLVLYVGDTSSINAFSINGRGDKAAITPIWGSSDNTIASVSNGLVTAVKPGRTEISINYTDGTKTFSKKVYVLVINDSVAPTDVVGLKVFPESLIMKNNDSKQLRAFLVHADGSETPVKASLVSKNPSILTVNDQTITADIALSAFETTEIIASYNTDDGKILSDTVFVSIFSESVDANEVVGINTDQSNLVLYVGDTSSINAFSINGRGDKAAITPIWGSSDNTIASVSGGLVTAVKPGRTEISINYTEGTKTFSKKVYVLVINVSVAPTDVVGLEVFPSSLVLEKNEISNPLQVYEILANGSQNLITGPSVTALSSDPAIATVSSFSVKGILKGKTSVVVSYLASGVQRNTSIPVTVLNEVADPNSVIGLSASPDVLIMNIGDVRDVSIFEILAARPEVDVTNINTTFSSANVNIATVTGNTITAINSGVVEITAVHTTSEGDVFDTAITIIVNAPQISSLSIQTCNTVYAKGESFSCAVKATYSNGDSVDISSTVDVSSSDELIIQSNKQTRVFYASNVGSASLTFKYGGLKLDHVVTIDPPKVVSVVPNTLNLDLPLSFSQPLKIEALYSDNHVEDVTSLATYVSSDTGIVSVAADGEVTGITPGTAVIVATFSGVDSNDINITVLNKVLRRLVATPAQLTIPVTFEREITVKAEFSDGTTLDVTDQANYTADNYSIVSLNKNKVTGLSSGITDVRANYLGVTSTTVKIEVTSAVLQRIELTPANPIIALGYTETLRAEGIFDDGTTVDLSNNVLWTTDNPTVLTSKSFGDYLAATMGVATLGAEYSGVRGETIANVVNKKLIKIIPNNTLVFVPAGISRQITFQGEWSDGSLTPLTSMYWQQTEDKPSNSSDAFVSRVSISGLIETFSAGSSAYTASYAGVSSPPILVLVTAPGITGIELTYLDLDKDGAPDDKIYIGKNTKIKVEATVSTGEIIDVSNDSGLSCTSLDPMTATISGVDITGVDTGVTAISCNYNNFKRTANLEVTTAFIVSITLTSSSSLIDIPTAVTFTVVGHYSDGVDKDITTESVFSIIDSPRDARFFPVLNTDTTTSANDTWYADNLGSATVTATVPNATTLDGVKTASVTVNTDFDRAWYYLGNTYTYGLASNQINQEAWRCPTGFALYLAPTTFGNMITTLLPAVRYEAASRDATNYVTGDNPALVRYNTGNSVANMVTGALGSVNWATNVHVSCTKPNARG